MTDITIRPAAIQMTMEQWKRTHNDFKTCKMGDDKGRWVVRMTPEGTTFVAVEIVKADA